MALAANNATTAEQFVKTALPRLHGADFLTGSELQALEQQTLLDLALQVKAERPRHGAPLAGHTLALIFAKPSTRTRVSFEVAMRELGGDVVVLDTNEMQLGRGESIADTGAVLSRYVSAIAVRTFGQKELETLAAAAAIPVINALTDAFHPCQALADLMTLHEIFGKLSGLRLAFIGDGNNVAHSLMVAGALAGLDITVATPPGREPAPAVVQLAGELSGGEGKVTLTNDAEAAVSGADAVYTDVWFSMGNDEDRGQVLNQFAPYQVNEHLMALTASHAVFMHCLPAHRGEEVTDTVIDGPRSVVLRQAENRLHVQKALLLALLGGAMH